MNSEGFSYYSSNLISFWVPCKCCCGQFIFWGDCQYHTDHFTLSTLHHFSNIPHFRTELQFISLPHISRWSHYHITSHHTSAHHISTAVIFHLNYFATSCTLITSALQISDACNKRVFRMPVCHPVTVPVCWPQGNRGHHCAVLSSSCTAWYGQLRCTVGHSASLDDCASSRTVHTESFILTNSALVIENPHSVYPYFKCCTNGNQWSRVTLACYCHL